MNTIRLRDVVDLKTESVNPAVFPDRTWHLYSLPGFDEGQRIETVRGSDIGSVKFVVPKHCILFNKLNVRFKRIWKIDNPKTNAICSTEFLPFVVKDGFSKEFVYQALRSDAFTDHLSGVNTNTSGSHKRVDPDFILDSLIPLPDRSDQLRIAGLLGSLDEKIALCRKEVTELEGIAKLIYDRWFVEFEFPNSKNIPYRSNGGLMVWNEELKREIPSGWSVDNLYRIANYVNGCACQKYPPKGERGLPVVKIKEMHEGFTNDTEFVSSTIPEKYVIEDGSLLFSWSASLEVMRWTRGRAGLNQHIFHVVPKTPFPLEFVTETLARYIVNFKAYAEARKTTMGHITSDHIDQSRIVIPPANILSSYHTIVSPIFDRMLCLEKQMQGYSSLRDRLLPMLMNGQVEVAG